MFPNNSSIDINIKKLLATCHKETQTSNAALKDSGTATGSENVDTCDKGSLKVFEFSELVQDPKRPREITIIKDVYAEEIHDHNSPTGSSSDDAIANRYTYCREVIKPYLKDYPKDCPVSDDQLIRDALEAAHEDFPDYEPCFEGYEGSPKGSSDGGKSTPDKDSVLNYFGIKEKKDSPENKKVGPSRFSIKDESSSKSSLSKKDQATSKSSTCVKKEKKNQPKASLDKKNSSNTNSSTSESLNSSSLKSNMDPDKVCPPAGPKIRDRRCPKKSSCPPSLEPCFNPDDPPPGPPAACQNKTQEGMSTCRNTPSAGSVGPCEDKPLPKKEKSCEQPRSDMKEASRNSVYANDSVTPPAEERKKTMMEAHSETIATIKTAVEDFFGKVYQTTKEAVTVIRTESAKHLGRMTAKKSGSSNTDLFPQKVHENKSSETITSFSYFRSTDNPDLKNQSTDNDEVDDNLKKAGQAIGKIFATVDSTISMLSDQIDLQKVTSVLKFESKEESSPYDKVTNRDTEEAVSTSTSLPNSVFTAIKSRIVSMFSEGESDAKKSTGSTDSSSLESKSTESVNLKPSKKRF